jgi:hypothetical protein
LKMFCLRLLLIWKRINGGMVLTAVRRRERMNIFYH